MGKIKQDLVAPYPDPFNSPIECGLRGLVLLLAASPDGLDLQRLVQYDYLLVHSGDVDGGPKSIHPAVRFRSGELLVRRQLVENGLALLHVRALIEKRHSAKGIYYFASESAGPFLDQLGASYTQELKARARWVLESFSEYSDLMLSKFMRANWDRWGSEFSNDSSGERS
jgi:hypothetical protein